MTLDIKLQRLMYQSALNSQNACNASGLVKELAIHVDTIWAEAKELGFGTDWVNTHPVMRLYMEQLVHLCPTGDPQSYAKASAFCVEGTIQKETTEYLEQARNQGTSGYGHYLEDFLIERSTDGRCVVRVQPQYKKGTHWQVGQALTHRLCSEILGDNVAMKENLGYNFRGAIHVDTTTQSPETGWIIMEAMDQEDVEAAVALAEFVHEGTELMN